MAVNIANIKQEIETELEVFETTRSLSGSRMSRSRIVDLIEQMVDAKINNFSLIQNFHGIGK